MSGVLKAAISVSFLVIRKRPEGREVGCMAGAIEGLSMARIDQLLGLTREGNDIVPDDADADV